jgi:hypothetical protein
MGYLWDTEIPSVLEWDTRANILRELLDIFPKDILERLWEILIRIISGVLTALAISFVDREMLKKKIVMVKCSVTFLSMYSVRVRTF